MDEEALAELAALAPEPAGDGPLPAELAAAVGERADQLAPFARHAAEVLSVGLESVVALTGRIDDVAANVTDYQAIEAEFGEVDHIGLELRVALSETDAYLAAALLRLEDAGALFMLDTSAEQMADEQFAAGQLEAVSSRMRELLDLVSLTLFAGGLAGAEATLSDARLGQIDFTVGMLADMAQGAPPVRLDFAIVLPDERRAQVTLLMPATLLTSIAETLAEDEDTAAVAPPPVDIGEFALPGDGAVDAPPPPDRGFGLSDDALNITPLHPGGDAAGGPDRAGGPDVPVHPVRFPRLGDAEPGDLEPRSMDMLMDVSMRVTVELGRSTMTVEEILALGPGSVVELNKLAGEPVDILANGWLIARGEVVVVDENFGVRVIEIVSPRTRAQAVGQ